MTTAVPIGQVPGAIPLLGHLLPLLRRPFGFLASLPEHGELVRVRIGPLSAVMVCSPELVRTVLLDARTYDKGGLIFDRLREVTGDGVATCPYDRHKRLRRLTQPAFHQARLPAYAERMTAQIDSISKSWQPGQVLDVRAEALNITTQTLQETMFSTALPSHALSQPIEDFSTLMNGVYLRALLPSWWSSIPTPANRAYDQARARLRTTLNDVISERRASGEDHGDLLSALLQAHGLETGENARGLTDTEISDQVTTFFLAGSETTAAALSWALHLLAQHPAVERRVHTEVDSVLSGRPASLSDLPHLGLTSRVVTETLRLNPPAWMLSRIVTTDTTLGGHRLPAGTTILYSPYLIHHSYELYEDPDRFDPDRWDASLHEPPPRNAFIAFGSGTRMCLGDQYGLTEAVLALATIAARWRLEPVPGTRVRPKPSFTLGPTGLRMKAIPRSAPRGL
jgi:cytochrome P450